MGAASDVAALAKVSVHVRRVRPYTRVVPLDDPSTVDGSVLPLDWETRAAPLGGLSLQPASVQKLLRKAVAEAQRQAKLDAIAQAREAKSESEAAAVRAEEERKQQLVEQQQQQAARAEVARRLALEQQMAQQVQRDAAFSKVLAIINHDDGYKVVVMQRSNGDKVRVRRDANIFQISGHERQLVLDFESKERAARPGRRIQAAVQRAQGRRVRFEDSEQQ